MYSNIQIPVDNINICLLGCVSAGKSTILNAMFCQDFSESKIKRTTMIPTAFVETRNSTISCSQEYIFQKITEKNKEIIQLTEGGQQLHLSNHSNQLIFNVDKLDIEISKNFNVTVFDIPGLNDARTKEEYFNYLRNNFYLFNIVIFVVNIESGLNTSDEMDILNLIAEHIEAQSKLGKNIKMLTIANKADEMQIGERTGIPEIVSEELKEMYKQINTTIGQVFKKKKIESHLVGTVPVCGIDAHLFRMIKSKGSEYNLNPTQIQKIGISEMGTRFRSKSANEQKIIVDRVLADKSFVELMIKLSGFERIDYLLADCIGENDSKMAYSNIKQELANVPAIDINIMLSTLIPILKIYIKLQRVDIDEYNNKMNELVKQIHSQVFIKINSLSDISEIISKYNQINCILSDTTNKIELNSSSFVNSVVTFLKSGSTITSTTIKSLLSPFHDFEKYPCYLTKKILDLVIEEFNSNTISISKLEYFNQLETIGILTKDVIELMISKILSGSKSNRIVFTNMVTKRITDIFDKINCADNFIPFIRYLIRNKINSSISNPQELIIRLMLYKSTGEIPLQQYLVLILSQQANILTNYGNVFDMGFDPKNLELQDDFAIDKYYIEFAKIKCPNQFVMFNQFV
jgi:GTPase SAR1 family protein